MQRDRNGKKNYEWEIVNSQKKLNCFNFVRGMEATSSNPPPCPKQGDTPYSPWGHPTCPWFRVHVPCSPVQAYVCCWIHYILNKTRGHNWSPRKHRKQVGKQTQSNFRPLNCWKIKWMNGKRVAVQGHLVHISYQWPSFFPFSLLTPFNGNPWVTWAREIPWLMFRPKKYLGDETIQY